MDKPDLRVSLVCQKIIEIVFGCLFFFVPLVFTTVNYELFEFNKMFLVYLATIIIVAAWLIKMIREKRLIFQKTSLFWPLLIFFLGQTIATIASVDPYTSFWGYYTRQNGGLLSFLAYILLYFAFAANIGSSKAKHYLKIFSLSLVPASCYGLLQKTGFDNHLWAQDVPARIFSTLGQPNWLAAWITSLIFLNFAFFNQAKKKSKKALFLAIFLISFLTLVFTRSRSGFLAFWFVYLLGLIISFFAQTTKVKKTFLLFGCLAIILTAFFLSPFPSINQHLERFSLINPQSLPKWAENGNDPDLGSATADIRKTVWEGAITIFKNYPLLGTGPETFAYSYYWYQPQSHNQLSEWDFLYNKAHNEYLNFLATTGLVGFTTHLGLIGITLALILKKLKNTQNFLLTMALGSGYLTILITNFFGFSVVVINLLFFLIPAFTFVLNKETSKVMKRNFRSFSERQKILTIIILLVSVNLVFGLIRYWLADYYFYQGEKSFQQSNYSGAYFNYQRAQHLRPQEPFYTNKMATNCAYLAIALSQENNQKESDRFVILSQELAQKTLKANPHQVNFYRQQSQTYYLLSSLDQKYQESAYRLLLEAHRLAPVNPRITYNLGILVHQQGNLNQAINWLETTIRLKPDYQDGYYWLAKFYQENGQTDKAKERLKFLIGNLNPEHPEGRAFWEKLAE
ncbi:MAG: O-antigen ligase family protein [Candidatus Shapirobacteria bacterium]|nr:O-antigen ligase family protein [Candidatus Shapirobacteria bacterium]MDD5073893.1 O-antigen ligase family protein [Candidatus Shapirobacteria bacterium]MDD5481487.1 O-antigen ligase family protein [Candidatus Shapirobacteria bacterium]